MWSIDEIIEPYKLEEDGFKPSVLSDLLGCPFCGGSDVHIADAGFNHVAVRCKNRDCEGQGKRDKDSTKAIMAWNMRAT